MRLRVKLRRTITLPRLLILFSAGFVISLSLLFVWMILGMALLGATGKTADRWMAFGTTAGYGSAICGVGAASAAIAMFVRSRRI